VIKVKSTREIRLVFLGGVGEIGMNSMAIETPNGTVVVDCGVMFPQGRNIGPELIIPDLRYYRANHDKIVGVVVTHAHEDHVGAVSIVFGDGMTPVYAPPFAAALMREKMREVNASAQVDLHEIESGSRVTLAGMEFEFIHMTHSIPDAMALAIRTPLGLIVHTGDFRIDDDPTMGEPFKRETFARLGDEGVFLMLSDSTNVERSGPSHNERWVAQRVEEIVARHSGRVLVSMFSSNIERVRLLADVAKRTGRRLGIVGNSLYTYSRVAIETGYAPFDPNELVAPYFADELPGEDLMLLVAGSQGEARASLTRVASGEHPDVSIKEGDMVIYSSRIIPGNEKEIQKVSNDLVRRGAIVLHEGNSKVHTSGHAMQGELMEVLELLRPKFFIPVHGEYRFLKLHADLAVQRVKTQALVPDVGHVISLTKGRVEWTGTMDLEPYYVEGSLVGSAEELKLKERRKLMFNGVVSVRCRLKLKKKKLEVDPIIELVGLPDPDGSLAEAMSVAIGMEFANRDPGMTAAAIQDDIKGIVKRIAKKRQDKRPVVLVSVDGVGR